MSVDPKIEPSWLEVLESSFSSSYFVALKNFLVQEKKTQIIFPKGENIFAAFNHTPFKKVKVVILGQDPYHGIGQANGLCFSVNPGVALPPSLKNIYKELHQDIGIEMTTNGDLSSWADQGVLLLNSVLTVKAHNAASHRNQGWETFTDDVISAISENLENVVFLLWGNYAKNKGQHINAKKHHVLTSAHPSPFSAYNGFFGNKHFSKTNQFLKSIGKTPIKWESIL